jgi:hypothetical protein
MSTRASMPISKIYRWPLTVAVVTAFGLAAALAGDGIARIVSWIALAVPVAIIAACLAPALQKRQPKPAPEASSVNRAPGPSAAPEPTRAKALSVGK